MHEIIVRGATIIHGSGRKAFTGGVAIDGLARSAARRGRRDITADGLLVTPGWVDIDTHYDGQATWNPILAPSSWHGVPTVLFGNAASASRRSAPIMRRADHPQIAERSLTNKHLSANASRSKAHVAITRGKGAVLIDN